MQVNYAQPEGPYEDTITLRFYPQGQPELMQTRTFTISRAPVLMPTSFIFTGAHTVGASVTGASSYKESGILGNSTLVNVPLIVEASNLTGNAMRICRQSGQDCSNLEVNPTRQMPLPTNSIRVHYDFPVGPVSDTVTVRIRSSADPSQVMTQTYNVVKP